MKHNVVKDFLKSRVIFNVFNYQKLKAAFDSLTFAKLFGKFTSSINAYMGLQSSFDVIVLAMNKRGLL
jgi:hypothetical protein